MSPRILRLALLAVALASASAHASDTPPSPAALALHVAYATQVALPSGSNLDCRSRVAQDHEFVRCAFETGRVPHQSLWLIEGDRFYALNGTALSVLDKVRQTAPVDRLPPRKQVDLPAVLGLFEGRAPTGTLVSQVDQDTVSDQELTAYCAYMRESDALSLEANRRFGAANPLSEARTAWIEPKLLALIEKRFTTQGLDYHAVLGRVLAQRLRCP